MPHECTACGRTFADGSKEMLSGCPDCGGTKFQFRPRTDTGGGGSTPGPADTADPDDDTASVTGREWPTYGDEPSDERRVRGKVGSRARDPDAADADRSGGVGGEHAGATASAPDESDDGIVVADEEPLPPAAEDAAQADARAGVAAPDEVAANVPGEDGDTDDADTATGDDGSPDLSALREELNDQFESIRIVSPGQYELNLMELYEREEHIISLREDGRYVIEVPESWRDAGPED